MAVTGIFSKIILLPAWDITGYRTWIAALALFLWVRWREGSIALDSPSDYFRIIFLGVLLGIHWIAFFYSMQIASIAIGIISLYTFPIITVLLEPFFNHTKIDWRDIVNGLLVVFGIYWLVPHFDIHNAMTQGVFWGVIAALTFALRNLCLRHWFSGRSAPRMMGYQVLVIAVLMTPVIFLSTHVPTAQDWLLLVTLGLVFTAFTHTLFGVALRYLKAKTVALVSCIQPLYGVIFGVVLLHSVPDVSTIIGGVIILLSAVYESVREHNVSDT